MPLGPKISTQIKYKIAETYVLMRKQDPKVKAKEVQYAIEKELHRHNPNLPDGWPGLSAVQKEITEFKKGEGNLSPEQKELDCPWGLLDIAKYPIPLETLDIVLTAWGRELLKGDPLTIREVLWIAPLNYLFNEWSLEKYRGLPLAEALEELEELNRETDKLIEEGIFEKVPEEEQAKDDIDALTIWAKGYAFREMVFRVIREHPSKPEDMWEEWDSDKYFYQGITGERKLPHKVKVEVRKRGLHLGIPNAEVREAQKRTYRGEYKGGKNERPHTSER